MTSLQHTQPSSAGENTKCTLLVPTQCQCDTRVVATPCSCSTDAAPEHKTTVVPMLYKYKTNARQRKTGARPIHAMQHRCSTTIVPRQHQSNAKTCPSPTPACPSQSKFPGDPSCRSRATPPKSTSSFRTSACHCRRASCRSRTTLFLSASRV